MFKNLVKGNIPTIAAIVMGLITMTGSVFAAKITADATTDKKNIEQDNRLSMNEEQGKKTWERVDEISKDVKIIKCAVIGRNDPVVFAECERLNK